MWIFVLIFILEALENAAEIQLFKAYVWTKRFLDVVLSVAILAVGLPIWLLVAVLVKATSRGPVFFRQRRLGRHGKPFTIIKFRTMHPGAEMLNGPQRAMKKDPRITRLGRFLRRCRMDEVPQFINVLRGEMSVVGPRPEREFFVRQLSPRIPGYLRRMSVKPGITGWAQVNHKYDENLDDVRCKALYDLYYIEHMSMGMDLLILVKTIVVILTGRGAR